MAILNILRYPDPRLHKVAVPVTVFDERLEKLVADMAETMYDARHRPGRFAGGRASKWW
jgi:peptide deformylase